MNNTTAVKTINKLTDSKLPYVGMHATISYVSDCYPYEVIEVSKSGKRISIRRLDTRAVNTDPGEDQKYEYYSNENFIVKKASLRKDGYWKLEKSSTVVTLGYAKKYIDPHF